MVISENFHQQSELMKHSSGVTLENQVYANYLYTKKTIDRLREIIQHKMNDDEWTYISHHSHYHKIQLQQSCKSHIGH